MTYPAEKHGPIYDMHEIPESHSPLWKDIHNRHRYEEDMRIHAWNAIDRLDSDQISEEEKRHWEAVIRALGDLALFYKGSGFRILNH